MRFELKTQSKSVDEVVVELIDVWNKSEIPIKRKDSIKRSINKYYESYRDVMKNIKSNNVSQKEKEYSFQATLSQLFDISDVNAMNVIDKDRKEFLICNKTEIENKKKLLDIGKKIGFDISGRNSTIVKTPELLASTSGIIKLTEPIASKSAVKIREPIASTSKVEIPESIINASGEEEIASNEAELIITTSSEESETDFEIPCKRLKRHFSESNLRRKEKQKVVTTEVAAALDRCGVSDRCQKLFTSYPLWHMHWDMILMI